MTFCCRCCNLSKSVNLFYIFTLNDYLSQKVKRNLNNKKIEQAKIEADKELALKELELKAQQDQASTSLPTTPPPHNKDAKLPSFIDEKDELDHVDSYLLCFECFAIMLSALLTFIPGHLYQDVRYRRQ